MTDRLVEVAARASFAEMWPQEPWEDASKLRREAFRRPFVIGLAALREAGAIMEWRPIESVPKDDTVFLAGTADGRVMIWNGELLANAMSTRITDHLKFPATHWQPLPQPPEEI